MFGQLETIFVVPLPAARQLGLMQPKTLLLALIRHAATRLKTRLKIPYYEHLNSMDIVDVQTIQCVVGRVHVGGNRYAIIDRSGSLARVDFD
jgi:hypothetical protein